VYTARQLRGRPADFGPLDALRLGTIGGARTLGRTDIGALEPGYRADIAVWPGEDIADMPDALTALVLGPDRKVRHLLVDGVAVVTDGQLLGVDLPAARRSLTAVSRRLDDA
jgi:cytosine/adenosine deaminase-related metal-dependent hydrolase